ncbi:unnamed protein product [Vitrella brassicaformis CCMP3155]|uniref:Uncharacterized protein n=1 Tax=Vitrella brassicaformis (strain CCMP3155) TaxID=1169540 RepID=A0A0G4EMM7_VITBC|nr:unnamed protein product [Vitrella brassicaformis CCMP3155]|eukprot:CEL98267.1 unnamed protein product [Vitrella brassicaformis CCMP3155]
MISWLVLVGWCGLWERVAGLEDACRNPLFQPHWYGKKDIQTYNDIPQIETNLQLCPQYNELSSCCHQTLESEQLKYYHFWRSILDSKIRRLASYKASVMQVKSSAQYSASSPDHQKQFDVAVERITDVLDPAFYAPCYSRVLEYAAGMICFGCKPDWKKYVAFVPLEDDPNVQVIGRLNIDESSCYLMWGACEAFGDKAAQMHRAILDSSLVKQATKSEEDFNMFTELQPHWYGKKDIQTYDDIPQIETNLQLCPQYNELSSCCHQVKSSAQYSASSPDHQKQFDVAVERITDVLDPAFYAPCYSRVPEYAAGMICFGCKPDWKKYVAFVPLEDDSNVQVIGRLNIDESSCYLMWGACEAFGDKAAQMHRAILDSSLVKQATKSEEDFNMFTELQWAHDTIALHPFVTPNEAERENAGPIAITTARQLEDDTGGSSKYSPVTEGVKSGFNTNWASNAYERGGWLALGVATVLMALWVQQ